ncbi:hypothetical protein Q8A67_023100 [Cirrhinus molitorella]|uniref:Uncharacterized protein n=1 Tax=Cirrhinus molitorella TaxID=172907 RepID=A0AA88PGW5_9TELE|nr:hypothetical protein Q8A67_023100 [Cirrhinus molitorella]
MQNQQRSGVRRRSVCLSSSGPVSSLLSLDFLLCQKLKHEQLRLAPHCLVEQKGPRPAKTNGPYFRPKVASGVSGQALISADGSGLMVMGSALRDYSPLLHNFTLYILTAETYDPQQQ